MIKAPLDFNSVLKNMTLAAAFCSAFFFGKSNAIAVGPFNEIPIPAASSDIDAWATSVVDYSPAAGLGLLNGNSANAIGPASGSDTVSLGDLNSTQIANLDSPGSITLGFSGSIYNDTGWDFAVFENALTFSDNSIEWTFAELAYVEVSTNGTDFARFPSVSLTFIDGNDPLNDNFNDQFGSAFGSIEASNVSNLAGKHATLLGTPFELDDLTSDTLVINNIVDLNEINFIRIVDIPGDGSFIDSSTPTPNGIIDAWDTTSGAGNGGFDLDAVAVNHFQVPEPTSFAICILGIFCVVCKFRYRRHSSYTL